MKSVRCNAALHAVILTTSFFFINGFFLIAIHVYSSNRNPIVIVPVKAELFSDTFVLRSSL
jgi:hypothetical protein